MKLNEMTELYISYRRALGEKFKTNAQALRSFMKHIGGDTNPVELTVGQVEPYLYYPTGTVRLVHKAHSLKGHVPMGHVTGYNEQCTPSRRLAQAFGAHDTLYL